MSQETPSLPCLPERIRHVVTEDYDEARHAEGRCQMGKVYNVLRRATVAELEMLRSVMASFDGDKALVCDCDDGEEHVIPLEECFDEHGRFMIDLSTTEAEEKE